MKAVILDDEIHAIENLVMALEDLNTNIDIVGKYQDPIQAINYISQHPIDVLFIDISMPKLSGFDVLDAVQNNKLKIVMVTAHSDRTIDAIRKNVFDYLLKPINIDELENCIERLNATFNTTVQQTNTSITIKSSDKITILKTEEIIYLQADNTYTYFHLKGKKPLVSSKSIAHYEGELPKDLFLRCHNSYLVNRECIVSYLKKSNQLALSNGDDIPVSRQRKNNVVNWMTS